MKTFLTNKGITSANPNSFFEEEKQVNNESKVVDILNVLYINVGENSSGIKTTSVLDRRKSKLIVYIV